MKKFKVRRRREVQRTKLVTADLGLFLVSTFLDDNPHLSVTCEGCASGYVGPSSSPILYAFLHEHSTHMLSYRASDGDGS